MVISQTWVICRRSRIQIYIDLNRISNSLMIYVLCSSLLCTGSAMLQGRLSPTALFWFPRDKIRKDMSRVVSRDRISCHSKWSDNDLRPLQQCGDGWYRRRIKGASVGVDWMDVRKFVLAVDTFIWIAFIIYMYTHMEGSVLVVYCMDFRKQISLIDL